METLKTFSPVAIKRKKPYKELTLKEKVELIRLAEENSSLSQANIAERYCIAKSNVCRILQRKVEYLQAHKSAKFDGSRKRKLREDSKQEGNETLRAHMLKQHQISRMFMCRCCNWAFPDKTSLHMHMQLQGKNEEKESNVSVIGKSNPSSTMNNNSIPKQTLNNNDLPPPTFQANSLFTNPTNSMLNSSKFAQQFLASQSPQQNLFPGMHPMSAALLAAAANAGLNTQQQQPGLFPSMSSDSLLNLNNLNNLEKSNNNGLFPQLSMMQRDSADLLSKLRQRLFFTNMWANKLPSHSNIVDSNQNNLATNSNNNEKLLSDFLENNNEIEKLNGVNLSTNLNVKEAISDQQDISEASKNSEESQRARGKSSPNENLSKLMQILHKNALAKEELSQNNNNNILLTNNNTDSNADNNNNSTVKIGEEDNELESIDSNDDQLNFVPNSEGQIEDEHAESLHDTTFETNSPSMINQNEANLSPKSDGKGENWEKIREQNENLMQKLMEFRQNLIEFINAEQMDTIHADFLHNLLKLTYFE